MRCNNLGKFLGVPSLFRNFLGIFLCKERAFLPLFVHSRCVPSIFLLVQRLTRGPALAGSGCRHCAVPLYLQKGGGDPPFNVILIVSMVTDLKPSFVWASQFQLASRVVESAPAKVWPIGPQRFGQPLYCTRFYRTLSMAIQAHLLWGGYPMELGRGYA